MGSFNTVVLICPSCGRRVGHQSKSGSCRLKIARASASELLDVADAASEVHVCPDCATEFILSVQFLAREEVKDDDE